MGVGVCSCVCRCGAKGLICIGVCGQPEVRTKNKPGQICPDKDTPRTS